MFSGNLSWFIIIDKNTNILFKSYCQLRINNFKIIKLKKYQIYVWVYVYVNKCKSKIKCGQNINIKCIYKIIVHIYN